MKERTLVLVKPDGVVRGFVGEIITRFEKAGLKIVGMKMVHASEVHAGAHYDEDISNRLGEHIRKQLIDFLQEAPILAFVLEGVNAIAVVRKIVGATEPTKAAPGTIRGDYAHVNYAYANEKNIAVRNLIHASSSSEDAEREIKVWFTDSELFTYTSVHDSQIL